MSTISSSSGSSSGSQSAYNSFIDSNVTKVGVKGSDPFPAVDKLWDVFAGKGIRTVFLTIGTSKSPLADLEIAESLGCPLHVCPLSDSEKMAWSEVSTVLKDRKRDASDSPFTEFVDTKWILPKNVRILDSVPWWFSGKIDISGVEHPTKELTTCVESMCTAMKLKDSAKRIDILKIDTKQSAPGLEIPLLYSILSSGFRPSVVMVKWSKMPDVDLSTTISAGHLQCSGYSLLEVLEDKFLYYFNDSNLYEVCSWEERTTMNPIANEIIRATSRRSL